MDEAMTALYFDSVDDEDDSENGPSPFWHPVLLGEVCVGAGIFFFLRLVNCEAADHECGGRRVAFVALGLPLFSAGTFFVMTTFLSLRLSCLSVIGLWSLLALSALILTAA
jgi:hypothetical protein